MVPKEESCLEELKVEYTEFRDRFGLPEFDKLNENFDIEGIDTDSDFLLRKIRRVMSEKIAGFLRFSELVLNPSNAPMFFFKLVKKLDSSDRIDLTEVYEKMGEFEVRAVGLDVNYSEEKEAGFIKDIYEDFEGGVKEKLGKIIEKLNNGKGNIKKIDNGSYFG